MIMTLENKKEQILRCIKLGMDVFQAQVLAECTNEEVEALDKDAQFQRLMEQETILEEYELLEKHKEAMNLASSRGSAVAIQWKLEKLNPRKWGKENDDEGRTPFDDEKLEINLIGRNGNSAEKGVS